MNDFLYNRRKELGYTLEEVGNMVGVGKSTVRKWEKGMIENMGRDKIVALSKALNISPIDILDLEETDLSSDITLIYNQLEEPRQNRVYKYAEYQLEEQNKIMELDEYRDIKIQSTLSAGTGIIDLDPDYAEDVRYKGEVPEHDLAFKVSGDSMAPLFEDGEIVFVKKIDEPRYGQICALTINDEAYIKKLYIEENGFRLVSLNRDYEDIITTKEDEVKIVGKVIL